MWTCGMLKQNARQALWGVRYWRVLGACLLAAVLGGNAAIYYAYTTCDTVVEAWQNATTPRVWTGNTAALRELLAELPQGYLAMLALVFVGVFLAVLVISLAIGMTYRAFVANPVRIGLCRYLMEHRQGRSYIRTEFSVFSGTYLKVVKAQILTDLKILLGTFLFYVPGILWSYQYLLVPYLLAENPYMTSRRARELSRQIMHGEKWHIFLLQMSFIGWYLLCVLTLGLGFLFLAPYYDATMAEFYAAMRSKALAYGYTDEGELGGFVVYEDSPRYPG